MATDAGERRSGNEQEPPRTEAHGRRAADGEPAGGSRGTTAPASVDEALARARHHGQAALAETLAAVVALLDAASLATSGSSGRPRGGSGGRLAPLSRTLEQLREWLEPGEHRDAAALLESFLAALDAA